MSTSTAKKIDPPWSARRPASSAEYLGPATLVETDEEGRLWVELPDGEHVSVEMALAIPYEAALGDTLLVIGRGDRHYVIGVLHGTGRTVLTLPGDVDLRAEGGALSLSGDRGVSIRGPEVEVTTTKLRMIADAVVNRFTSVYQRVSDLLSVQAGEAHTLIEKSAFTKARDATLLTEETVTVNGKQIHLG